MNKLAYLACLIATVALAQSGNTMKGLVKDAVDTGSASLDPNAPDVTKMPFSRDSIKKVVEYHQPKIQECYEETLAGASKAMEGKLATHFVITPEGMVKGAKVEKKGTSLKEPKLHECVVAVLSTMTFPKPADGKDHPIDYPFNLKAIK